MPQRPRFGCPTGQALARKQLMRKDRAVIYAAQPEVCGACPLKSRCTVSPRRIVTCHLHEEALQRMQQRATPEAMRLRRVTVEHLRTSTLPAAWTARSANGNQPGRSGLQSEAHGEHSRRMHATCSPAGHLILFHQSSRDDNVNSLRQNKKAMLRHSEHRSKSLYHSRFVTV